ncbi:hypothetical protein, partial [Neisseria sp. HMSC065D04]|uniref:hypothetical protein n=1 Tax=Neisseria sp. HMSC065D04 TaxID=1739542 RepID=UPI000B8CEA25
RTGLKLIHYRIPRSFSNTAFSGIILPSVWRVSGVYFGDLVQGSSENVKTASLQCKKAQKHRKTSYQKTQNAC